MNKKSPRSDTSIWLAPLTVDEALDALLKMPPLPPPKNFGKQGIRRATTRKREKKVKSKAGG